MKNELAREISLAEQKIQCDTQCKRVLANKIILAWILKYTVEEFAKMSIPKIQECIENDVYISKIRVSPGETNMQEAERIKTEANEDKVPGEGDIYFDIRFTAILSEKREKIKLMINVEAQKDFYPGYSITTRGIYYGARMISAQKGIGFTGSDYDHIRKVYSIWICMNAPKYIGNAISEYRITKKDLAEGIPDEKSTYDKLSVVIVCLNEEAEKGNKLTEMLSILFSMKLTAEKKIKQLEEEFQINMEKKIEKELNQMCNYSDYVEEVSMARGMEKGMEKGIEKGRSYGRLLQQIEVIQKKCAKEKDLETIAEEMEEEVSAIEAIYQMVKNNPGMSEEEILEKLLG